MSSTVESESEYTQSLTITFEWTLKGLKNLFDSSKGDTKSKTTKSMRFGDGRWQILFYANAGTTKEGSSSSSEGGGGYVSLYLSCEPTQEEKDTAVGDGGKWVREGVYQFSFELKNVTKTASYNLKEAHNHTFSHKTSNWGWAQFAKRDVVYYNANSIKTQDAFTIICIITSLPAKPTPPPIYNTQSVPKRLLETVGALLDDPLYSDVEFVIPGRRGDIKSARKILASKTLLKRADYFKSMFGSAFAEGSSDQLQTAIDMQPPPSVMDSESHLVMNEFEDSDDDEDDLDIVVTQPNLELDPSQISLLSDPVADPTPENLREDDNDAGGNPEQRNVRAKLSHPSSPRTNQEALPSVTPRTPMLSVVVKDVAYTTYKALLYYLYTDIVTFAPLMSSFTSQSQTSVDAPEKAPATPPVDSSNQKNNSQDIAITRRQWIQEWKEDYPDRPHPCSAKAMYRLADRIDLPELKARAAQVISIRCVSNLLNEVLILLSKHIVKSLSVDNIAYEIFSPFAAAFDDIRKIEVDYFLAHWREIRASDSMRNVWQQIRNGRHPGFEEVWPVIASNLEFQPSQKKASSKGGETAGDVSR
ncbi:hypothetical protein H0H87_006798 [Tephrocybe sp. NHM501043]|nr:hypothetical protein H0H87_006798 [Tephrocybe sp. NHM501043]